MDESHSKPSLLERISALIMREPEDRDQLIEVLRAAHERNLLDADALSMIEGVLQVSELQARDIMVPRSQMDVIDVNESPDHFIPFVIQTAHSRFPVTSGNKDDVLGILLAKDLLRYYAGEEEFNVREMLRPAVFIPESKPLNVLLKEFRKNRNHIAIVVDEYGGVAGLITIEDVLEQIVGEIEDEFDIDEDEGDIFGLADRTYRVSGDTAIGRVGEAFGVTLAPTDDEQEFDTIGGLIAHEMGHVPKRGEHFALAGLNFVVLHTKGGAVRWFKVSPAKDDDSTG
jgi:magnesium and cobalt transporter